MILFSLSGLPVFAQEVGSAGQNGPSQAEIDAEKAKNTPSEEQIQQFEKEFGGPPESLTAPSVQKPTFEQPSTVPEEVKKYVSDKDLVAVYCAMTKWKSGDFFSGMEAVNKYVIEPSLQIKSDFGLNFEIPDVGALVAEAKQRTDAICNASSVADAEKLAQDFYNWGQTQTQGKFDSMRTEMQSQLKEKSDALKDKIKKEIDPFIEEQKASIEGEMQALADKVVEQKKSEIQARLAGAKSAPDVGALKAEISAAVNSAISSKIEEKKAALKSAVQAKVNELIGPEKAKFEKIGETFSGVEQKINDYIISSRSKYDQYKKEAFDLRKKLVLDIVDKNLEEGIKKIDASAADLEEAKKNDSSVKTATEIKAELQQDRKNLEAKLDAALEAGDENAFQQALNDFKAKWEAVQANGEKAMEQSVSKVCTIALAQFDNANKQMDPGIKQIQDLQSRCANSVSDECLKANEFSSSFESVVSKSQDLKTEMAMATKMCQNPQTSDRKNLIVLMKKIQSDAEDFKVYGQALEAEKSKALAQTAQAVCAQALPQLAAAETEIKKNDLTALQNNVNQCIGQNSEECVVVNKLSGSLAKLKLQISAFLAKVQRARTMCSGSLSDADFKTLADTLNSLKSDGEELRASATDLMVQQAEKMNEKVLCRAAVPNIEIMKQQIAAGFGQAVSANAPVPSDLNTKVQQILAKISEINKVCVNASANNPGDNVFNLLESLKQDKAAIDLLIK